jgi:hypothetical protein
VASRRRELISHPIRFQQITICMTYLAGARGFRREALGRRRVRQLRHAVAEPVVPHHPHRQRLPHQPATVWFTKQCTVPSGIHACIVHRRRAACTMPQGGDIPLRQFQPLRVHAGVGYGRGRRQAAPVSHQRVGRALGGELKCVRPRLTDAVARRVRAVHVVLWGGGRAACSQ